MPKPSSRILDIIHVFEEQNPHPEVELDFINPFTLLIAVLLSAQATDKHVNKVTEALFKVIQKPQDVIDLGLEKLQDMVKSINYFRNKAKHIYAASQKLIDDFNGEVPTTRKELMTLPGIGQKSANVILNVTHNAPYIPVDTHVFRVSQRIGLCKGKTPEEIERQLEAITPDKYLGRIGGWLVLHGRYICKAQKPLCEKCPISAYCDYYKNVYSKSSK